MKSRFKIFFLLSLLVVLPVLVLFSAHRFGMAPSKSRIYKELGLFVDVISMVEANYVEKVSTKKLIVGALTGMLKSLDPYSQFLDEDDYNDLKVDTNGQFGGVGVEVSVKAGLLRVITPLEGTPAQVAGLRPGDAILKIDGVSTHDMALEEAVKRLRGAPGTLAKLTVMREKENKLIELSLLRDIIRIKSIPEAKFLGGHVGYIKLAAFQEESAKDFEEVLKKLEAGGMRGLVLDLRNNPGGLFDASVEIAEKFIPKGKLIVSTKGRDPKTERKFFSNAGHAYNVFPLVVLVNKGSASSSEILAGAIQDHKLGTVLGVKTFGKGSIQTLMPLPDDTAIRLTTSKYYTPSGRLIHEVGIAPDVTVENSEEKDAPDLQLDRAISVILRSPQGDEGSKK